jgi:hypothetical protein
MAEKTPQSYRNHTRFFAPFHFVVLPLLLIYFLGTLYLAVTTPGLPSFLDLLLSVALMPLAFSARRMALTVQDRVVRLEERLRMRALLPADLQPRIGEVGLPQLIALRFASDEELPALARDVIERRIEDPKAIKQAIRNWRADHQRA